MRSAHQKKQDLGKSVRALSLVGNFGLTMGAGIVIGYYTGSYIDSRLGTEPWFMLVLVLLFMAGAFIKFIQTTREVNNDQANQKKQ